MADSNVSALKIQTHRMFLDTNLNSAMTVLSTIYQNFVEAAMKYHRYAKCMGGEKHPQQDLLIGEPGRAVVKKAEVGVGGLLTRAFDGNTQVP